jgi:HD-GYP domain-containing protein (c-di-GMP phosphodiesterase class II)
VAGLAVELGRRIGLSGWRIQALEYAALLHDIGYLSVGKCVLAKGECLSPGEWAAVRGHAEVGASIISRVRALRRVSEIVRAHHERPDGKGYPGGLSGEEIPRESRVLKVADAFVAMTSNRPYRKPLSVGEATKKIRSGAGTHFDIQAVRGLLDLQATSVLDRYGTPLSKAA